MSPQERYSKEQKNAFIRSIVPLYREGVSRADFIKDYLKMYAIVPLVIEEDVTLEKTITHGTSMNDVDMNLELGGQELFDGALPVWQYLRNRRADAIVLTKVIEQSSTPTGSKERWSGFALSGYNKDLTHYLTTIPSNAKEFESAANNDDLVK